MKGKNIILKFRELSLQYKILIVGCIAVLLFAGSTAIYFMANQKPTKHTAVQTVSVASSKPIVTSLSVSQENLTLECGKTTQISAKYYPSEAESKILWKSSDEKIASVDDNGTITAVAKGTCTVTATAGTISKTIQVTVNAPGDEEITLLKDYLKNGLQTPTTKATSPERPDKPIDIKKLYDAAIIDLNGDNHYELLVEHLFNCHPVAELGPFPFFELYYVQDGKVVKGPTDFGRSYWEQWIPAGVGNDAGSLEYYLAQDTQTNNYYFVEYKAESESNDSGHVFPLHITASTINRGTVLPIMKMDEITNEHGTSEDTNFTYSLAGTVVTKKAFSGATNRLKPVYFHEDNKPIDVNRNFDPTTIKIFKNSQNPTSFLPAILQNEKSKTVPLPKQLLGMKLSEAQKLYGNYQKTGKEMGNSFGDYSAYFDNFSYEIGYVPDISDPVINALIVRYQNDKIYPGVSIGMTYSQIKAVFGDKLRDLMDTNGSIGLGKTAVAEICIDKIDYSLFFDGKESNSKCTEADIFIPDE